MGNHNSFISVAFTILIKETNKMCAQSKLPNEDEDPQYVVPQSKLVPDYGHEKLKTTKSHSKQTDKKSSSRVRTLREQWTLKKSHSKQTEEEWCHSPTYTKKWKKIK